MMDPWCVRVHLPEDCRRLTNPSRPPKRESGCPNCHRSGKRKLGSRKNAHRHCSIFCSGEPTCAGTEITCGEFVADLCWPRPDVLKAVVTHRRELPWWKAPSAPGNISALAVLAHQQTRSPGTAVSGFQLYLCAVTARHVRYASIATKFCEATK